MITFAASNGKTYKIWWKYIFDNNDKRYATTCIVAEKQEDGKVAEPVASATIHRHSTDKDDKELARMTSLKKAIASFGKVDRKEAYFAYFNRGL